MSNKVRNFTSSFLITHFKMVITFDKKYNALNLQRAALKQKIASETLSTILT